MGYCQRDPLPVASGRRGLSFFFMVTDLPMTMEIQPHLARAYAFIPQGMCPECTCHQTVVIPKNKMNLLLQNIQKSIIKPVESRISTPRVFVG
jgi:hypothetical protein